jgi:heme-degrading monooxygenase HmoA
VDHCRRKTPKKPGPLFILKNEKYHKVYSSSSTGNAMPHMLVHHKVRDFAKWKPFFDRDESNRKALGSKGAQVFQNIEDPTDVFLLIEWDSAENAKKFGTSGDLKKTMEAAGVVGAPHIHLLKEVQKSKA